MSSRKVVLILGSGPNIGGSVSRAFAAKGYTVALASRSVKAEDNNAGQVNFQVDLTDPPQVSELFAKVKETVGIPSVVVYNGLSTISRVRGLLEMLTLEQLAQRPSMIQKTPSPFRSTSSPEI